jgi:hypothetical protein
MENTEETKEENELEMRYDHLYKSKSYKNNIKLF